MKRLFCLIFGHVAKGAAITYCGTFYIYRCQRCGSGVREWWG